MRGYADVVDAGVSVPARVQLALKALHARRRGGKLVTTWRQSRLTDAYLHRVIRRRAGASGAQAVLQIGDLAILDRPYFLYQDFSFDALLQAHDEGRAAFPFGLTRSHLLRRRDRQRRVYERAAGVFAMSRWFARHLVDVSGLPPERVHVLHPGRSAVADGPLPERRAPRRRLLMVATGFLGKGGDLVLAALALLRREVDPAITLTVVGPRVWPLPGGPPDGVDFLGPRPRDEVAALYDRHDLFVLPSRLEGFGIVLAEAVARGLPCIARDAYAMPEVVEPGVTGSLLTGDDPAELAGLIASALADDSLYAKCRSRAGELAAWFSWDRAGRQAVDVIGSYLNATENT